MTDMWSFSDSSISQKKWVQINRPLVCMLGKGKALLGQNLPAFYFDYSFASGDGPYREMCIPLLL